MIRTKSCLRCQGDMVDGEDADGQYWYCVQCGHQIHVDRIRPIYRVRRINFDTE